VSRPSSSEGRRPDNPKTHACGECGREAVISELAAIFFSDKVSMVMCIDCAAMLPEPVRSQVKPEAFLEFGYPPHGEYETRPEHDREEGEDDVGFASSHPVGAPPTDLDPVDLLLGHDGESSSDGERESRRAQPARSSPRSVCDKCSRSSDEPLIVVFPHSRSWQVTCARCASAGGRSLADKVFALTEGFSVVDLGRELIILAKARSPVPLRGTFEGEWVYIEASQAARPTNVMVFLFGDDTCAYQPIGYVTRTELSKRGIYLLADEESPDGAIASEPCFAMPVSKLDPIADLIELLERGEEGVDVLCS
jgi:ribosomal protein S27E